jgi:hypothetical protein
MKNSSQRLSYKFVQNFFKEHGCDLLENSYSNARTPMRYRCSCGNESKICFYSFKSGNRCKSCGSLKISKRFAYSHQQIEIAFSAAGCLLLDQYERSSIPMRYICSCGREAKISWNNFRKGKRCWDCGVSKRSGEHHYEWVPDREKIKLDLKFRQRSYKLLRMTLAVTGRVKNDKTAKLLGYDYKKLQTYITNHPNYENVKNGRWHIDHIFPIKAFVDHNIFDLSLINCLENLRPITASENHSKNAKYNKQEFLNWIDHKLRV